MLNFPNLFSIVRIISIFPLILLLTHQLYGWACVVFIAAALTDAVDGALARLLGQRTVMGAYLDPAADKLLMTASFIILAILGFLPLWLAFLVIFRDVVIVLGLIILRAVSRPPEIRPSLVSKSATLFQLGTIGATLLYQSGFSIWYLKDLFIAGTLVTTVISGLQYVWKGINILKKEKG
jgi:cardiolipin synthase